MTASFSASSITISEEIDSGIGSELRVHYFTMVEGRWKSCDNWAPPANRCDLLPRRRP
jgi:hypothetical protein